MWQNLKDYKKKGDKNGKNLKSEIVYYGEDATAPILDERLMVTWDKDFTNVKESLKIYCHIEYKYYYINLFILSFCFLKNLKHPT